MEVLLVGTVALVQFLETALVSRLRGTPGCRNIAAGGESPPPPSFPCYLYVVVKSVDSAVEAQLRRVRGGKCLGGFACGAKASDFHTKFRFALGVVRR